MKYTILKISLILLALFLFSCFEDIVDSVEVRFSNSADLITYTETRSNFFNRSDRPSLVTVDELNQNISNYLVLDIRDEFDYKLGHISGAINIKMKDLIDYLKELNTFAYQKIVIISSTGQLASYASCLLYLTGFTNVYTLDRGMTYWNHIFSNELRNAQSDAVRLVRNQKSIKRSIYYSPPVVFYKNYPETIEEKMEDRVQQLLNNLPQNIFTSAEEFDALFSPKIGGYINSFVIYSIPDSILGLPTPTEKSPRIIYGPISVTEYDTRWDFISNSFLLTLPTNKNVVLYSPNGQRSAYFTAYLQLLGYQAITIKYGAISMMVKRFYDKYTYYIYDYKTGEVIDTVTSISSTYLTPYGFEEEEIRDYHFEVGE
ncbi:MAG: hypothetical protein L3J41_10285 [Melioribacteraceae bacterium]|nr:hypothetical protein [Melioribacteraceae bacterium]